MKKLFRLPIVLWSLAIILLLLVLHWLSLNTLPVFADEAIYIRWAQLIIDDANQYLFFPMNDGKTPLFIWMLIPFLKIFEDQLIAGRVVAVLGGVVQVIFSMWLVRSLKGNRLSQLLAGAFSAFLPFWYFHHQMALMDGWLTAWLTLTLIAVVQQERKRLWLVVGGLALGAAFWTKLPAVLFLPAIVVLPFAMDAKHIYSKLLHASLIIGIGVVTFATLKISPAFPQLFFRGSDFLYPVSEVLAGKWTDTLQNAPTYFVYFWTYMTPGVLLLFLLGFGKDSLSRRQWVLLLCFLAFVGPITLLGKVVYPRYFLPSAIFLTVGAALSAGEWLSSKQRVLNMTIYICLLIAVYFSGQFIWKSIVSADQIPFVDADKTQYLTEWSSGHGIHQVYEKLVQDAQNQKIAVGTEGFFGTLPDGLLLYLHNQNVDNILVEGVGEPVVSLPPKLVELADKYDRQWLLVNSHRLKFEIEKKYLLEEYCRPYNGPCLQLWDVTELVAEKAT